MKAILWSYSDKQAVDSNKYMLYFTKASQVIVVITLICTYVYALIKVNWW